MNLSQWLVRTAARVPERDALFRGTACVASYREFAAQAGAVAGWLQGQGVRPSDRVAIFMHNTPEYLVLLYGIWMAGAAAVPINAKLHGAEARYILENADVAEVFASPPLGQAVREAGYVAAPILAPGPAFDEVLAHAALPRPVSRTPQDLAWLFYTSGTTGKPKGVMITHGMLAAMALCYEADVDQVTGEDTAVYGAPLSHGAGLYNLMHVRAGARHVCPASAGFDVEEILSLAAHFGQVHMFAAPTMVKRLTAGAKAAGSRGAGLKTVIYAGGPMYTADIIEAVEWFGPVFAQIYGQGECPMAITVLPRADVCGRSHPRWRARLSSVGVAQGCVEVQIGDDAGAPLPMGEIGEIMVRGVTVMPGYWRNDSASAEVLRDGWLRTGDMGSMDAEGYVTLQDRSKDMIITGGSNVYPREVEEVLMQHVDVREASVVGRPHPEWGEEVVAFVVGSAQEEALDQLCLDQIARFKRPKVYLRVDELPKNNYGKVLKTELRALAAQRRNG